MNTFKKFKIQGLIKLLSIFGLIFFSDICLAAGDNIGTMAANITKTFDALGLLITAASYIAGLGFAISAILKFKQHKDNPQQTPVGQPIGLMFIAVALLFLPSLTGALGNTAFTDGGKTAGPGGTEITGG